MTLEELARRAGISKAYLSLIETGRVANPPSDQKLRRIEESLGIAANELIGEAHLQRTPRDVRAVLHQLIRQRTGRTEAPDTQGDEANGLRGRGMLNLDDAYLSGVLQEFAERNGSNVEPLATLAGMDRSAPHAAGADAAGPAPVVAAGVMPSPRVPVVNRVSAGYPTDFTDMSYPPRNADAYITAPGLDDPDAFAARVSGDSMSPKYAEGDIVIFSPAAVWKNGADCFVRFEDGQTTFKRVYAETDGAGREMLRLQPRNSRYTPQVVPREKIEGAYRAIFCYRCVGED